MSTRTSLNSPSPPVFDLITSKVPPASSIQELNRLATQGLVPMLEPESRQFCHRLVRTETGMVREGLSPRYTIMTLLGLREFEKAGGHSSFDTNALYECFIQDTSWIRCSGDLGLTIWLMASFAPDQLQGFLRGVNLASALSRYADARQGRTTELAWFLAGLSHAAMASSKLVGGLTDIAVEAYHRIEENQGEFGYFGHMHVMKSVPGLLRGRIGSFADQIYPIYAMSKFATTFHVEEPLGSALECGRAICRAQGALGQWWWLYDSQSGHTSSRYPVYSVHQQAMAPMGLFALEEATGQDFKEPIFTGLQWIYGSNELGVDMRDLDQNLVWRCILPKNKQMKYWDTALSLVRSQKQDAPVGALEILFEDRPYELGWLLYAFAKFGASES